MVRIAIFGSGITNDCYSTISKIIQTLHTYNCSVSIFSAFANELVSHDSTIESISTFDTIEKDSVDYVFSLGGDGTFLKCAHFMYASEIPILGINFGKLGFLADVMPEDLEKYMPKLLAKEYTICNRTMLDSYIGSYTCYQGVGLNEITIQKSNFLKLIRLQVTIDNKEQFSFWADGIIVSTPTGSTGYSLSLGGPIISPSSNSILLTPIAPHTLSMRPLIIPDTSVIEIEATGEYTNYLVSNDFNSLQMKELSKVIIQKSSFSIKTIQFYDFTFINVLQNKLHMAVDVRK